MTTPDDKTLDELVDRIVGLQLERSSHDDIWQALRDSGDAIAALRAELDALLRVVAAADAMRDMGVSIGQQVVHPEGMPDDRALYEFIGLFDGPFQRDYDAARAALKEPK